MLPARDIPLDLPLASTARASSLRIAGTVGACLVAVVVAMIWAVPLSPMLAINLFRVAIVLWLANLWDDRRLFRRSRLFLPLLCFVGITALSSLVAEDRTAGWEQMKVMELGFASVVVADALMTFRQLTVTVIGVLVTGCVAAGVAIWQVASGTLLRAQAFSRHYVDFGEMALLLAPLSFGLFSASLRHSRRAISWTLALASALLTVAIAATATRTLLAALLLGFALIVWMHFGWKVRTVAFAGLAIAVLAGGLWLHSRRGMSWFDASDPGTQYRFLIWRDGAHIIRDHPLLGIGFANAQRHPERYDMSAYRAFPQMISHFHSTPIELAADCGLPALAIWCWLMYACWVTARRALRASTDWTWLAKGAGLGILGVVSVFQLVSLVHYIAGDPDPMLIFWSLIAFAIILERHGGRTTHEEKIS